MPPETVQIDREFYGTVEGDSLDQNVTFVRAIVHFADCDRVNLFAFIRYRDTLYQIRPILHNLVLPDNNDQNNAHSHELFPVVHDLDSDMFTANSMAIQNANKFDLDFVKKKRYGKLCGDYYERVRSTIEDKLCCNASHKFVYLLHN